MYISPKNLYRKVDYEPNNAQEQLLAHRYVHTRCSKGWALRKERLRTNNGEYLYLGHK